MRSIFLSLLLITVVNTAAQNDRVNDYNNTNWMQVFAIIPLHKKWSVHAEYQWRRTDGLKDWQQGLFRTGVNYKLNDHVILHAGYAEAETYAYGNFPIASNGTFPEHRLYEQLTLRQPVNKFLFTHRFRIEQRWLGKRKAGTEREIEEWLFLHRFRYQFRAQLALTKKWYAAAADEIFIGAGKNVGVNIFDQNRIFLLAGHKFNPVISIECGYFNQTLQQGRRINNTTITQRNNGVVISSFVQL